MVFLEDADSFRENVDSRENPEDGFERSLRPKRLSDYIGQENVREKLNIAISASARRNEPLDHILLHGPPGLGKTTLSSIVAAERGVDFKSTSGPVLERPSDLAAILSSLNENDVLFIDEIHRLSRVIEEILYPALEDFSIDIVVGQGAAARSVKLELRPFTLVGATTRVGALTAPLRDRFGIIERVDFYKLEELVSILNRSSRLLNVKTQEMGIERIASSSRGTPRIANRLLRRVRDYAEERAEGVITEEVAKEALSLLEIDNFGLDKMDRLLLKTIIKTFRGGPVGVETLAASMNEEKDTIEDVYEPFLMQKGFIMRTPRGRVATDMAYQHFRDIKRENRRKRLR